MHFDSRWSHAAIRDGSTFAFATSAFTFSLVANTSNMPVAAREVGLVSIRNWSIYLAVCTLNLCIKSFSAKLNLGCDRVYEKSFCGAEYLDVFL